MEKGRRCGSAQTAILRVRVRCAGTFTPLHVQYNFICNCVIIHHKARAYIATIDVVSPGKATHVSELIGFGWIYSPNGETWEPEVHMVAIPGGSRTPLGLVPAPEAVDGDDGSAGGDATIVNGSKGARLAVVYSSTSDHKPLKCCPPHGQTFPLYGAILEAL